LEVSLFIIDLLKESYLIFIVCGTEGMILHYVLNGIWLRKIVLMLGVFKVEALVKELKMV
jgi:hypothetical protein